VAGFRNWCHINEFRMEGYSRLPSMIALSDPLVLWAPAPRLIDEYHSRRICPFSSADLLAFVEDKHVVIAGRREWLVDAQHRNQHSWPYARWYPPFDDRIKDLAIENEGSVLDCPVAIMRPETGWRWADEQLRRRPKPRIVRAAQDRLQSGDLPRPFIERAMAFGTARQQVRSILRDLRNHAQVQQETRSQIPILAWHDPTWLLSPAGRELRQSDSINPKEEVFLGATVKLMDRIGAFPTVDLLPKFLREGGRKELQAWFSELTLRHLGPLQRANPEVVVRGLLDSEIAGGLLKRKFLDYLMPSSRVSRGIGGAGVVLGTLLAVLGAGEMARWVGLSLGAASTGEGLVEWAGLRPLGKTSYRGPLWPFLCTLGRPPRKREVEALRRILVRR